MAFRFRRSLRLLPGVRINFGKRGISATVGVRGAGVTIGSRGTYLNVGLPGTGISYRTRIDGPLPKQRDQYADTDNTNGKGEPSPTSPSTSKPDFRDSPSTSVIEFKSIDVASLGSESLARVSALLDKLRNQRESVSESINRAESDLSRARKSAKQLLWLRRRVAPAADEARQNYARNCEERLEALKELKASLVLGVEFAISDESKKRFLEIVAAFDRLSQSKRIWDVTAAESIDRARTRSAASQALNMHPVNYARTPDEIMASSFRPPHFVNYNGADLLLYPAFVAAQITGRFSLLDIREVSITTEPVIFVADNGDIPADAEVVGNTWRYVNKDGSPDRRFSNNPRIPLVRYCKIFFRGAGLNEAWMVSDAASGFSFGDAVRRYKDTLKESESDPEGIAPPAVDEWPDIELPERILRPLDDFRTPLVLYGGIFAAVVGATAIARISDPKILESILKLNTLSASADTESGTQRQKLDKAAPSSLASETRATLERAKVVEIQTLLRELGFDPGPADGILGTRTRNALKEWAAIRGVHDPKMNEETLIGLRQSARANR